VWTPQIKIDGADVLAQGVVVSYGNQPIDIYPLPPPFDQYQVRLIFTQDTSRKSTATFATITPNLFQVTFTNFDEPVGVGTSYPIYIANYNLRKVMLSARISLLGFPPVGTRTVWFTIVDGGPSG
jgi:hypothetical protein